MWIFILLSIATILLLGCLIYDNKKTEKKYSSINENLFIVRRLIAAYRDYYKENEKSVQDFKGYDGYIKHLARMDSFKANIEKIETELTNKLSS